MSSWWQEHSHGTGGWAGCTAPGGCGAAGLTGTASQRAASRPHGVGSAELLGLGPGQVDEVLARLVGREDQVGAERPRHRPHGANVVRRGRRRACGAAATARVCTRADERRRTRTYAWVFGLHPWLWCGRGCVWEGTTEAWGRAQASDTRCTQHAHACFDASTLQPNKKTGTPEPADGAWCTGHARHSRVHTKGSARVQPMSNLRAVTWALRRGLFGATLHVRVALRQSSRRVSRNAHPLVTRAQAVFIEHSFINKRTRRAHQRASEDTTWRRPWPEEPASVICAATQSSPP